MNGKIKPEEIVSYTYTALEAAGFESLQDALKELKAQRDCVTMLKAEVNRLYKLTEANREVAHRLATTTDYADQLEDENAALEAEIERLRGRHKNWKLAAIDERARADRAEAERDRLAARITLVNDDAVVTEFAKLLDEQGLVIVPKCPTSEMLDKGSVVTYRSYDGDLEEAIDDATECWKAMLGAYKSSQRELIREVICNFVMTIEAERNRLTAAVKDVRKVVESPTNMREGRKEWRAITAFKSAILQILDAVLDNS